VTKSSWFRRWSSLTVSVCLIGLGAGCGDGAGQSTATNRHFPTQPARTVQTGQKEPPAPDGLIFRPTFETDDGEICAGTAFPLRLAGYPRPVIVTALHLLGPGGGMSRDVPPGEIAKAVKRLRLDDCFAASRTILLESEPLFIPDAAPMGKSGNAGDLAAFWAPMDEHVCCLEMSEAKPLAGESVWLAASLVRGAPKEQRLHRASVLETDADGLLLYRYENPKLSKQATSGAPIVNQSGQLVAINLGGYESGGTVIGAGNPVSRFRKYLEAAAQRSVKP
jgi:hypothetical protein